VRTVLARYKVVDISLVEPLLGILGAGPSVYDQLGIIPGRNGNRSTNSAPRNAYLTRDGRWVAVSAGAPSVAARVMRLVGRADIAEQPWFSSAGERVRHGDLIDGAVSTWIRDRDIDDVVSAFAEAGAALAPVYDVAQLVNDPQIEALGAVTTVQDQDLGPLRMQNIMFRLTGTPGGIRFAGRGLGQDNDEVYAELLGLDSDRLDRLRMKASSDRTPTGINTHDVSGSAARVRCGLRHWWREAAVRDGSGRADAGSPRRRP
jgi:crotonobetainyl-CoA:carnitine CoA-transferase CaiB-like acyl-CoA transferase